MYIIDKWWRHLAKTGTWRMLAFTALAIISYYVTGSLAIAGSIAIMDWIVKSFMYFGHEWLWSKCKIGKYMVEKKGCVVWISGISGSGKTTVADRVAEKLRKKLIVTSRLDGDVARRTFSRDLGFSSEDRAENCRRAAHVSAYAKESSIVIASFISPRRHMRDYVRKLLSYKDVFVIQIYCPLDECARRDPKGMYAQLKDGCLNGNPFTGAHPDAPYEFELNPDLELHTYEETIDESANKVISLLRDNGYV